MKWLVVGVMLVYFGTLCMSIRVEEVKKEIKLIPSQKSKMWKIKYETNEAHY
jgi:hypothetical protein